MCPKQPDQVLEGAGEHVWEGASPARHVARQPAPGMDELAGQRLPRRRRGGHPVGEISMGPPARGGSDPLGHHPREARQGGPERGGLLRAVHGDHQEGAAQRGHRPLGGDPSAQERAPHHHAVRGPGPSREMAGPRKVCSAGRGGLAEEESPARRHDSLGAVRAEESS